MAKAGFLAAILGAIALWPAGVTAEVRVQVDRKVGDCQRPFEVTVTGLEPYQPAELIVVVNAGEPRGSAAGQADEGGRFWTPIPIALLPCETGGHVALTLKSGNVVYSTGVEFDVVPVGATPSATPIGPATGNSALGGGGDSPLSWPVAALALAWVASCLLVAGLWRGAGRHRS